LNREFAMSQDQLHTSELVGFPTVIELPVQWGDQDAYQHVNNVLHFRWFESARIAYLEQIGLKDLYHKERVGPILAAINCNYRRQLQYPDVVQVGARITRIGRTSMQMEHVLFSTAQRSVVADGSSTIVTFDYKAQKPTPVPAEIRAKIEQVEQRSCSTE
jgi:acyl-CoA thioester hydrolase